MGNYFQNTMNNVGAKLNFARKSLQGRNNRIRDEKGFSYTADRILTSIGNFMDLGSTTKFSLNDAIANGMRAAGRRNFSASDLASVRDVDVADIAIATTVASHGLTYIAMERAMDSIAQQISFQGLRSLKKAGGVEANERVVDPRKGMPQGIDFTRDSARVDEDIESSESSQVIWAGGENVILPVVIGETKVVAELCALVSSGEPAVTSFGAVVDGAQPVTIAFDAARNQSPDGNIRLVQMEAGFIGNATVNINTGTLTIASAAAAGEQPGVVEGAGTDASPYRINDMGRMAGLKLKDGHVFLGNTDLGAVATANETYGWKLHADFCVDRIAENDGAHTLKLKPYVESAELVSTENRVVLQSSIEVQAQMNKVLRKNAQYGVNVDFGKRAIDQIVALYTYFIDTMIVRKLWEGVQILDSRDPAMVLDLSGFGTGSAPNSAFQNFVATKNDRLSLFTDRLCAKFLNRTGSPVTALIVDETAGLMYASDKENFVADPAITMRRDGLIGTYKSIPVVRNTYLNGKDGAAAEHPYAAGTTGTVIGVFKSVDGQAAPVAMGDYLPPYSTLPAVNANNPGELSQALFSQTACKCVVPEWAIHGTIQAYGMA